ncbi:hypothetical protein [Sphingosinicella sp. BN140058]|uniref:hypothetical protein n=1 Tax=Sphingosinicella sp. BN140058 TaxID=1892855 RepID=UPI0010113BE5|nr:hypothetical protein [Sphingosinicella sp. BN140058]QAY78341.1 hypothetical protein ETR14_18730 [Sphingosinicella sp. BN140058]
MPMISMLWIAAAPIVAPQAADDLAGIYDGGQTEIAAGLELTPDGRFRYGLSYGALDEQAAGRWREDGVRVLLTSDPVKAPAIVPTDRSDAAPGELVLVFDPEPALPPELFDAEIEYGGGRVERAQMSGAGVRVRFATQDPPRIVRLVLAMFDLVGAPVALDSVKGSRLTFRFEPNDLGRVAFDDTSLEQDDGALLLRRHDRVLRFRRVEE